MSALFSRELTTEEVLTKQIRDEIRQLRKWANESRRGGWSTHQVDPMRQRADYLESLLHSMGIEP